MHWATQPDWQHQAVLTLTQRVKNIILVHEISNLVIEPKNPAIYGWKLAEGFLTAGHSCDSIWQLKSLSTVPPCHTKYIEANNTNLLW